MVENDIEAVIEKLAHETTERIMGGLYQEAVDLCLRGGGTLGALFGLGRKSDLKKFCKRAEVPRKDVSLTIIACDLGLLPWRHEISHRNFVPDHLHPTEEEMHEISGAKAGDPLPKALRKIATQFDERRMLVGHMFYNHDLSKWHLLYFDQRDTSARGNHWKGGSHLHLVNWVLRPRQNANDAWHEFHDDNPKLSGALHIKCAFQ